MKDKLILVEVRIKLKTNKKMLLFKYHQLDLLATKFILIRDS